MNFDSSVVTPVEGRSEGENLDVQRVTEVLFEDADVVNNLHKFQDVFEFDRCERFQMRVLEAWMDGHMPPDDAIRSILTIWQESQGSQATLDKLIEMLDKNHFKRTTGKLKGRLGHDSDTSECSESTSD